MTSGEDGEAANARGPSGASESTPRITAMDAMPSVGHAAPAAPLRAVDPPAVSAAAEQARRQLHEELARVRGEVEATLSAEDAKADPKLRRELDDLREETRLYVKKRLRKSERKLGQSVRRLDERTRRLEKRIARVEREREQAEWRIHADTEAMLGELLQEIRAIADRLDRAP